MPSDVSMLGDVVGGSVVNALLVSIILGGVDIFIEGFHAVCQYFYVKGGTMI